MAAPRSTRWSSSNWSAGLGAATTRSRHLTDREGGVLSLMAEGRSNKAIAQQLFVTEHTVEKHVKSILGTLHLPQSPDDHRRVLAVLTYLHSR